MNKKIISLIILILFTCAFIITNIAYAIDLSGSEEHLFLNTNKQTLSSSENFEVTLDLSKIAYENFKISISSSIVLDTPTIDITENISSSLNSETNELTIIGNTSNLATKLIRLYYTSPFDISNIPALTLVSTLMPNTTEDVASSSILEDTITINLINDVTTSVESEKNIETLNSNESQKNNTQIITQVDTSKQEYTSNQTVQTMVKTSSTNESSKSSMSNSNSETVTYNGSSNNYLSSLSLENTTLTTDFSKINSTYFANVANNITNININYELEDSNSTVCIYGNTDLSIGTNKILITVTAENGNTRAYRIYVNRA